MKIAITGASGFVGQALCPAAERAGHEITRIALRRGKIGKVLAGHFALVHLAAIAHSGTPDSAELRRVNVDLAREVGQAAAGEGVRMIFLSSVKVYGDHSPMPLDESSATSPKDAYGASKLAAEETLRAISGLDLTILRPPLVYGPGVKANFLALMRAISRGWPLPFASVQNKRSFIYLGNLVEAILRCLSARGTFVVSDGVAISTAQLCREIGEALGRRARLFPLPPTLLPRKLAGSLEVDDSAIRRMLGWQPPFTRQAGLQATADWYLETRSSVVLTNR